MLISAVLFKGKTFAIASIGLDCGIANATAAGRMDLKGINSKARQTKNGASAFRHLKFDIKHITASDHKGTPPIRKIDFFRALPKLHLPPPPPNSGKLYNFFWTSKTTF